MDTDMKLKMEATCNTLAESFKRAAAFSRTFSEKSDEESYLFGVRITYEAFARSFTVAGAVHEMMKELTARRDSMDKPDWATLAMIKTLNEIKIDTSNVTYPSTKTAS